ncbi:MAG: nucleotidyltransferase family protein [Allosphingosinicella sp.]|uniref:nucleotidyltransferase family protein n=1 Tax=Allosphingosinicella sp. TaxID=2823234 RepID=UPI003948D72A
MKPPVTLSPELALAIACCRWPHAPEREAAISNAASAKVDWTRLADLAREHRIEALVHDGLVRSAVAVDPAVAHELKARAAAIAQANLRFAAEAARLRALFAASGVPLLFVKGVTLALLAYRTLAVKSACDLDLLIDPADLFEVRALLRTAGYVSPDELDRQDGGSEDVPSCKEETWLHPQLRIEVDLHHRLADSPLLIPGIGVASPSQEVEVGGGIRLPTLAKDELFAYLCVHGASHGWSRMKWIGDVAALLHGEAPDEIERRYLASQHLKAGRSTGSALLLCHRLFGTEVPSRLLQALRRDGAHAFLEASALHAIACSDRSRRVRWRRFAAQFLILDAWSFRFNALTQRWNEAGDSMARRLPQRLGFCRPAVRLCYGFLKIALSSFRSSGAGEQERFAK